MLVDPQRAEKSPSPPPYSPLNGPHAPLQDNNGAANESGDGANGVISTIPHTKSSSGIATHDEQVNRSGDQLHRFLLHHSATPPTYHLRLRGTHDEVKKKIVETTDDSGEKQKKEVEEHVTVTDFHFIIDLTPSLTVSPTEWSVADDELAYRGGMTKDLDSAELAWRRAVADGERGNPHAAVVTGVPQTQSQGERFGLKSSFSIREWADHYCSSEKLLKEFVYKKLVYGWDGAKLVKAIVSLIQLNGYSGKVSTEWVLSNDSIVVRPRNQLSTLLYGSGITSYLANAAYPLIWMWKRFSAQGGGRWEVCGAMYAFKVVERGQNGEDRMRGEKEGSWLRKWEGTIAHCVATKMKSDEPLREPILNEDGIPTAMMHLDGYAD